MPRTWKRRLSTAAVLGATLAMTVLAQAADAKWLW